VANENFVNQPDRHGSYNLLLHLIVVGHKGPALAQNSFSTFWFVIDTADSSRKPSLLPVFQEEFPMQPEG
jgi:hypothetical protein